MLITLISKAPFVDSDTRAIARVDADVVDFRVCGIQDRACGNGKLVSRTAKLIELSDRRAAQFIRDEGVRDAFDSLSPVQGAM